MATTYYYGKPNGQVEGPVEFQAIKSGVDALAIEADELYLGPTSAGPWKPYQSVAQEAG